MEFDNRLSLIKPNILQSCSLKLIELNTKMIFVQPNQDITTVLEMAVINMFMRHAGVFITVYADDNRINQIKTDIKAYLEKSQGRKIECKGTLMYEEVKFPTSYRTTICFISNKTMLNPGSMFGSALFIDDINTMPTGMFFTHVQPFILNPVARVYAFNSSVLEHSAPVRFMLTNSGVALFTYRI